MNLGTWNGMKKLAASVLMVMTGLMGVSAKPEDQAPPQKAGLTLVAKVPLAEFKRAGGEPIKIEDLRAPLEGISGRTPYLQDYGFIQGGKYVYFGYGNKVMEVATGTWHNQEAFPEDKIATQVSRDGSVVVWGGWWLKWDEATGKIAKDRTYASGALHPDTVTWADGALDKPDGHPVELLYITMGLKNKESGAFTYLSDRYFPEKRGKEESGIWIRALEGFTASGSHLVLKDTEDQIRLMDTRTMKLLPSDALGDAAYSNALVFNRDASLVAGGYENRGETFVWNRRSNSYSWEKKPKVDSVQVSPRGYEDRVVSWGWGIPSAFSPNDRFLLCEGVIVRADSGELAFDGLKGKRGKFSPDGRSLVTVDDEAFYVYTLPKESEPIFGVFQKPEPWNPGKAPARKPKGKAKVK